MLLLECCASHIGLLLGTNYGISRTTNSSHALNPETGKDTPQVISLRSSPSEKVMHYLMYIAKVKFACVHLQANWPVTRVRPQYWTTPISRTPLSHNSKTHLHPLPPLKSTHQQFLASNESEAGWVGNDTNKSALLPFNNKTHLQPKRQLSWTNYKFKPPDASSIICYSWSKDQDWPLT